MSLTVRTTRGSEPIVASRTAPVETVPPIKDEQPSAQQTAPVEPVYELVDLDRYVVMHDGPIGYVEVVPPLFVCYLGHPYPKSVEVAQTYDFQEAIQTVLEHAERTRRTRLAG